MTNINYKNLFNQLEEVVIIFDKKYNINFCNTSATSIINSSSTLLNIINDKFHLLIKNGVENGYPFIVKEHLKYSTPIFINSHSSYNLIIKPIDNDMFLLEGIETTSSKSVQKFYSSKSRNNLKKLELLNKIIAIKQDIFEKPGITSNDVLDFYEDLLHFELAMDSAMGAIYESMLSQTSTIESISKDILNQVLKFTNCYLGFVFLKDFRNSWDDLIYTKAFITLDTQYKGYLIDKIRLSKKYDNENEYDGILGQTFNSNEVIALENPSVDKFPENFINSLPVKIENILIVPINCEEIVLGEIVLINKKAMFKKQDVRAVIRLVQIYQLVLQKTITEQKLKQLATYDKMTNTLNRETGLALLEVMFQKVKREFTDLTICYIDINGLKLVNDSFGHKDGDNLIVAFCTIVKQHLRSMDALVRLGGDEFMIILPDTGKFLTEKVMQRVQEAINQDNIRNDKPFNLSISFGIAEANPYTVSTVDKLIEIADTRMYKNKTKFNKNLKKHDK